MVQPTPPPPYTYTVAHWYRLYGANEVIGKYWQAPVKSLQQANHLRGNIIWDNQQPQTRQAQVLAAEGQDEITPRQTSAEEFER